LKKTSFLRAAIEGGKTVKTYIHRDAEMGEGVGWFGLHRFPVLMEWDEGGAEILFKMLGFGFWPGSLCTAASFHS